MATITLSNPKFSFISLCLLLAFASNLVHSQDMTSFQKDTFDPNPTDLIYQGGAHVPPGSSFLRLSEIDASGLPVIWTSGRVLYSAPVVFREGNRQATFETTIRFIITPSSGGGADGLTFFIAPVNTTFPNSAGGNLGVFDSTTATKPSVFAVEFDTWRNVFDPSHHHIGVDIESITSRNTTEFESANGQVVTARINYDANTHVISVHATSAAGTAELRYVFNLRSILPPQVQVGISASTGGPVANIGVHNLLSWYFTSTLVYSVANEDTSVPQYI